MIFLIPGPPGMLIEQVVIARLTNSPTLQPLLERELDIINPAKYGGIIDDRFKHAVEFVTTKKASLKALWEQKLALLKKMEAGANDGSIATELVQTIRAIDQVKNDIDGFIQ